MKLEDILKIIFLVIRELIKLAKFLETERIKFPSQTIDVVAYYLLLCIFALDVTGIAVTTYIIYLML